MPTPEAGTRAKRLLRRMARLFPEAALPRPKALIHRGDVPVGDVVGEGAAAAGMAMR